MLASLQILLATPVRGQGEKQQALAESNSKSGQPTHREVLPTAFGNAWRAAGPSKQLSAEKFSVVQGSEVYLEYGLQSVATRTYTNGHNQVMIEAYELRYPSGAYGLFSFDRGSLSAGRHEFYAGRYLVRISDVTGTSATNSDLVSAIQEYLSDGAVELPTLPGHLPEPNKITASEKYLVGPAALAQIKPFSDLKGVLDFTGGAEAATAEYENGGGRVNLIIIDCYTPQLAADNYTRLKNYVESLKPEDKAGRLIKRIGNYVVEVVNSKDPNAVQAIVDQIKYAPRVYWEGDRFTSIPFEYRPPDPLVLEEARKTGVFLATAFYLIGLMIVGSVLTGIIAGGSFFYWRLYQRRKLGLGDAFSDGGGTIRLNLDNFLLPAEDSKVKLLGKGD